MLTDLVKGIPRTKRCIQNQTKKLSNKVSPTTTRYLPRPKQHAAVLRFIMEQWLLAKNIHHTDPPVIKVQLIRAATCRESIYDVHICNLDPPHLRLYRFSPGNATI